MPEASRTLYGSPSQNKSISFEMINAYQTHILFCFCFYHLSFDFHYLYLNLLNLFLNDKGRSPLLKCVGSIWSLPNSHHCKPTPPPNGQCPYEKNTFQKGFSLIISIISISSSTVPNSSVLARKDKRQKKQRTIANATQCHSQSSNHFHKCHDLSFSSCQELSAVSKVT